MSEIKELDPKIKIIEDEIIQFITNSRLFYGRNTINLMILGYFLTRRILTQKELRHLTGSSTGKISRELKKLVNAGSIKKKKNPKSSQLIYYIESVKLSLYPHLLDVLNAVKKWESIFNEIKRDIEENRTKLEAHDRVKKISEIVDRYLNFIPYIKSIIDDMENI